MNSLRRLCLPMLALACLVGPLSLSAHAQVKTPQAMNKEATKLMEANKWPEALAVLSECTGIFDGRAPTLYGPQFGITWFRRGICELKLGQWEAAANSFEKCYDRYRNTEDALSKNPFEKRALLQWGNAAVGAEQWSKALELYEKFLKERNKERDKFLPGPFFINLGLSHLKLGDLDEGLKHFGTALRNKERYRTPQSGIIRTFRALVEAVIGQPDEEAKLLGFLDEYRGSIMSEPFEMASLARLFLGLGIQTFEAGLSKSTVELFSMVPPTSVMLEDVENRLAQLGPRPGVVDGKRIVRRDELEKSRDDLSAQLSSGDPNEVIKLATMAVLHDRSQNVRGAYVCYRQLDRQYPKSKRREDHLYNLVRTTSALGYVDETEKFGNQFLEEFPESDLRDAVQRMMLTSLFYSGEYRKCVEIAAKMLPTLDPGDQAHEICLHALGGSFYYLSEYRSAQPELDRYVELYPEGQFIESVSYFQASNASRRGRNEEAAKLLDAFLKKYPDPKSSVYVPYALFDRARVHYAVDEYEPALAIVSRLQSEMPETSVMCMAYNLKGNIHQNQGEAEQAEQAYRNALETAERTGNRGVAAEALNYLISMLSVPPASEGGEHRMDDALPLIDKYWANYRDTPYSPQVAVSQVAPLLHANRKEQALKDLQTVIAELSASDILRGLENAISAYTRVYLMDHSVEELKPHYYRFPGVPDTNKTAQALLKLEIIKVYEGLKREAKTDTERRNAEAGIKVIFDDLRNSNDPKDLTMSLLVEIGDFIRGTSSPSEALPYYNEALARPEGKTRYDALLGRALVLAEGSEGDKKKSLKDFEMILNESDEKSEKEMAMFSTIETQMALKNFKQAVEKARLYLDPAKGYRKRKAEVGFMLGESYLALGATEDALATFINVANSYKGAIRISAPATKRAMEIFWERNQTSANGMADRQGAYNMGRTYIDQTRRLLSDDRVTDEEIEQWKEVEQLVELYVANPNVKSKEQQLEEAR